ncbi:MAG: hypothetical protein GY765_27285 [bacterium]|nr:hypothetical protein [bacterium]
MGTKREKLLSIFWDYDINHTADDIYDFLVGSREMDGVNRESVIARVLTSIRWYDLVDIFGLKQLHGFLSEDVLRMIWKESVKNRYRNVRETLQEIL